jgi:hypothetical protein
LAVAEQLLIDCVAVDESTQAIWINIDYIFFGLVLIAQSVCLCLFGLVGWSRPLASTKKACAFSSIGLCRFALFWPNWLWGVPHQVIMPWKKKKKIFDKPIEMLYYNNIASRVFLLHCNRLVNTSGD